MSIRKACISVSLFSLIINLISCSGGEKPKEIVVSDSDVHASLERLEERAIYFMAINAYDSALLLMPQLVHPSTRYMPGNTQEVTGYGSITYNQYWALRREKLRGAVSFRIDSINNATMMDAAMVDSANAALADQSQVAVVDSVVSQVAVEASRTGITNQNVIQTTKVQTVPDNLLGLYLKQYGEGTSKFYKIVNLNENYYVIYQDNLSDKVNIERFIILNYDMDSRTLNLESEINRGKNVRLKFRQDSRSPNGLILLDAFNNEFGYVQ